MTQAEINKNAVAGVMALEDAKNLYEAIGEINDDFSGMDQGMDPMEYSADDLLTVNPVDNDPMGSIPDLSGASAEMDEETQKFVVDRFAEMAAKLPGDTIDMADVTPIATVIKAENGIKQDVNSFLEKMMMGATQRMATQNVSEAQPNGVAIDFNNDDTADVGSDVNAFGGFDGIAGLEEAPGGIESPEPALDANVGDAPSFDGIGDDLGVEDADFGMGDAGMGDTDMGVDAGVDGGEFDGAAIDDALGATDDGLGTEVGDEALGDAGMDMGDDIGADDAMPVGEDGDIGDDLDLGGDDDGLPVEGEDGVDDLGDDFSMEDDGASDDGMDDAEFESAMNRAQAKLESIRGEYVQARAADKIRSIVESFQARKNSETKKAKLESIVANYKKNEAKKARMESVTAARLDSIVDNYARNVNPSTNGDAQIKAKLESIAANYIANERRLEEKAAAENAKMEAVHNAERKLKAKLESISAGYHGSIRKAAETDAKLESIMNNYMKSEEYKSLTEGATKKSADDTLKAKLDSIVASVK